MSIAAGPKSISLAYSVDADDAFMFHALREGFVATVPEPTALWVPVALALLARPRRAGGKP